MGSRGQASVGSSKTRRCRSGVIAGDGGAAMAERASQSKRERERERRRWSLSSLPHAGDWRAGPRGASDIISLLPRGVSILWVPEKSERGSHEEVLANWRAPLTCGDTKKRPEMTVLCDPARRMDFPDAQGVGGD